MVGSISSNYSTNSLQAVPLKKKDDEIKTALAANPQDTVQLSTAQAPAKKQKKGSFWEQHFAAIMGITSIALVGMTVASAIRNKKIKGMGEKGYKNPYIPELNYETVFHNYKNDKDIPTLKELAGMKDAKESLQRDIIDAVEDPEIFKATGAKSSNAVILHGPPGTGKTYLVKVLAKELDADVAKFAISQDGSPLVNQASINLKARADFVKKQAIANPDKQHIALFDEIEGMLKEDDHSSSRQELIKTLLIVLDEFKEVPNIKVIATTNDELIHASGFFKNMNEAAMDRFPAKIFIGNPDKEARGAAILQHLKNTKQAEGLRQNPYIIDDIAEELEGYSNRNIEQITNSAIRNLTSEMRAAKKAGQPYDLKMERRHFDDAIEKFRESKDPLAPAPKAEQYIQNNSPFKVMPKISQEEMEAAKEFLTNLIGEKNIEKVFKFIDKVIGSVEKSIEEAAELGDDAVKAASKETSTAKPKIIFPETKEGFNQRLSELNEKISELDAKLKRPEAQGEKFSKLQEEKKAHEEELDELLSEYSKRFPKPGDDIPNQN